MINKIVPVAVTVLVALCIVIIIAATGAAALPTEDEVLVMPGYRFNATHALPSRIFSGYVSNGAGGHMHYVWTFPEQADPAIADVIEFLNGGPGCSSLDYWSYEAGPFRFVYRNVTAPSPAPNDAPFVKNPWAITRTAHLITLEQPAGVGFSYVLNESDMTTNDESAADAHFYAMQQLLTTKFSEFSRNRFWASGESYGGFYVPLFSERIMNYQDDYARVHGSAATSPVFANFAGVIVGNGVTDRDIDSNPAYSYAQWARGHGVVTETQYAAIARDCLPDRNADKCQAHEGIWWPPHLNIYGAVQWCYNPPDGERHDMRHFRVRGGGARPTEIAEQQQRNERERRLKRVGGAGDRRDDAAALALAAELVGDNGTPIQGSVYEDLYCTDEYWFDTYFNRADVKAAFHVPSNLVPSICFNINYTKTVVSVVPIWSRLASRGRNLTVVIYNGLEDTIVPYVGTQAWMANAGWRVTREWRSWSYIDVTRPVYGPQLAGWAMQLQGSVWFVGLSGAGHMCPEDKPQAYFEMMERIRSGSMFPESVPVDGAPYTFVGPPVNGGGANADGASLDRGKWIGVGFAIAIGVGVMFAVLAVALGENKKSRSAARMASGLADGGAAFVPSSEYHRPGDGGLEQA